MNMNSLEQLRQIEAPTPDPAARLRARRAAIAEFRRIHPVDEQKPATSWWSWKSPWLGGFATASVVVVGVSLAWFAPESERGLQRPADASATAAIEAAASKSPAMEAAAIEAAPAVSRTEAATTARDTSAQPRPVAAVPNQPAPAPVLQEQANLLKSAGTGAAKTVPATAEADDEISEITVTGTRIQSSGNATAANPVSSITAEEMRQQGMVNVGDALLQLRPQNLAPAPPTVDPAFGTRTLTLVDGRRIVSTSSQADVVDLNTIPPNLLQRMDVVTGGAAASFAPGAAPPTTGRFEQFEVNPVKRVADEPVSTFSIDVDTASYSYARRTLNQLGANQRLPPMDSVRVEEMINYFDYSWPAPTSRNEPLRPTVTVSDSPWNRGRKLVHIGIKGYELPSRGKPDVNLVLLMDVSGSMSGADRLPLAKQSLSLLLDSLQPTDTVAIAVYAGAAGTALPPTPVRERATIQRALDRLQSGGSTAGAQGIQLAYNLAQQGFRKNGVNRILLATDGDFNVGISNRNELKQLVERERGKGIYLSVLGFGQGNYRDEVAQTLAQNGNGVAAYIDTLQEARKVLVQEATSSLFTIASDVKIQVEFNPATVAEYRLIGYETRALAREDFNNDKVDAGDVGSGHKVTAIYEITPVGSGALAIDERRYGDARVDTDTRGRGNEYGFLKIRYKLPGESESRLMQQPIRQDAGVPAAVRADVNFSTAVAGFAQLLRGGKYTGALKYDDVIRQAEASIGRDEYGYRAEFVQLARKARDVGMPTCINSPNIQSLNNLVDNYRQRVTQMLRTYSDQHPEVIAARAGLASAEASLAAEVARLSSQGVVCPAGSPLF
jgi:Ca-activated chloride channel family protein